MICLLGLQHFAMHDSSSILIQKFHGQVKWTFLASLIKSIILLLAGPVHGNKFLQVLDFFICSLKWWLAQQKHGLRDWINGQW